MSSPYTVMIVDDSFEDRFLLKRLLIKTGLSLVTLEVINGVEGIELLTTPVADLEIQFPGIQAPITLFLDINMPLMNGWEFIEELERRNHDIVLNPTVVLMYSTSDSDTDKARSAESKAVNSYIVKGESTPESLKEAILDNQTVS